MICFDPIQLRERVIKAIETFSFLEGMIDNVNLEHFLDEDCYNDYDVIITETSKVLLSFGHSESPSTSLGAFLSAYDGWKDSKINDKQSYAKSKNEAVFLLNIRDYNTVMLLDGLKESDNPIVHNLTEGTEFWRSQITVDQKAYNISLFNGLCVYHLLVEQSGNYDKYLPSYSEDDYFVRIKSDDDIDFKVADSLAISFVFELYATHNLIFSFSGGRADPETFCDDESDLYQQSFEIFPLLYGRGIKELLEIYNAAKTTGDIDYKLLGFTKVIEYISPTIAQEELYDSVRLKLKSPAVFVPTSKYINELGDIYKSYQNDVSKDNELIKLAVTKVIELEDIWDCLPTYIKPKNVEAFETLGDSMRILCIESLITSIYDTRNEIAHAKANYEKKGKECPPKYKEQFGRVLDKIAVCCIRWFAMQSDEKRVVIS